MHLVKLLNICRQLTRLSLENVTIISVQSGLLLGV